MTVFDPPRQLFVPDRYKSVMSGGSQYKFGVLARIVRHMKTRHQEGETHPLSIDEILDETNQLNAGPKVKSVSYVVSVFT